MSMREINIIVPPHKSDGVVKCLKEDCGIATIHRVKGESTHTVTVYATVSASGPILHYLDMIGVGVVYGRIAMLPTHLLKPLPRINLAQSTAATKDGALPTVLKREVKGEHARMAVEEIWAGVSGGCDLTADYRLQHNFTALYEHTYTYEHVRPAPGALAVATQ